MPPRSSFETDIKQEQILGEYLDGLYHELGMAFERIGDKGMQNQGVDLIVKKNEQEFLVDEKAQLDYIGTSMPTFAFEIGGYKDTVHKKGWLFDNKKLTTHYLLVTDIYLKEGTKLSHPADIASVSLLWLNRDKLLKFLFENGFDQMSCEQAEQDARDNGLNGKIPTGQQGLNFFLSGQKAEAPFNLVISRHHLLTIGKQVHPPTG